MEMPIDQEDFDNEIFETITSLTGIIAKSMYLASFISP